MLSAIVGPISLLQCEFKAVFAPAGAEIFDFSEPRTGTIIGHFGTFSGSPKWDCNMSGTVIESLLYNTERQYLVRYKIGYCNAG